MKIISKSVIVAIGACLGALYYLQAQQLPVGKNSGLELFESGEMERAFVDHLAKYGKVMTDKKEVQKRYQVFRENYAMIKAHNEKPGVTFKMALNQFADVEFVENEYEVTTGLEDI